jgi:diguanylate cyclase (GGDEF)-like protein
METSQNSQQESSPLVLGSHSKRRTRVVLQILSISVLLFLLIGFAFSHFYNRVERLLTEEKMMQNQQRTVVCASTLVYELRHDLSNLKILGATLQHHDMNESVQIIQSFKNPLLSLHIGQKEVPPFRKEGEYVVHSVATELKSKEQVYLELRVPARNYYQLLDCSVLSGNQNLFWLDSHYSVLWQFPHDGSSPSLPASLVADALGNTTLKTIQQGLSYITIVVMENGYGVLVLFHEAKLLENIYLTVLQSSVSLAVLVILILLILLLYLLKKDRQYEKSLVYLAYVDELTKLPNKNHFLSSSITLLQRARTPYAVIVLDIRKLKLINDHFGYEFGDSLLIYCAKVLPRYASKDGLCARLTGDKFILLCAYRSMDVLQNRLESIIEEIKRFSFPGASPFQLDVALGVSLIEGRQTTIAPAIDNALFALSALKERQGSGYVYYEDALKKDLLEDSELEKIFHTARENGQFFIMLQPKYSLHTKRLVGAEALVRWNHPKKGLLTPNQFIPMLEKHNLLVILDMFVLEEVCKLFLRWKQQGKPLFPISINQSRSHLLDIAYEKNLVSLVDRYEVPHSLMEFELTESLFLHDTKHLSEVLATLRNNDFLVSLDDFGSGYSSLSMLKDVQIDVIKMDQGFLTGVDEDNRGMQVVKHIIAMAKALHITTVAEGVETQKQVNMLAELGCDVVQGYYYSQPISVSEYEKLLSDGS